MKILLGGGYDTQNLGDHGSLEVFQRDLKKLDPSSEIVVLSRHPDAEFDETYNVRSILNLDHKSKAESIGRWFNGLNPGDDTGHLKKIWEELASSDLLVIGNGRLFVDIAGATSLFCVACDIGKVFKCTCNDFFYDYCACKVKNGQNAS